MNTYGPRQPFTIQYSSFDCHIIGLMDNMINEYENEVQIFQNELSIYLYVFSRKVS